MKETIGHIIPSFGKRWVFIGVIFIFLNIFYSQAYTQNKKSHAPINSEKYEYPKNPQDYEGLVPVFPGGPGAFKDFLLKNAHYKKGMINGKVLVYFEINADGSVCNIRIKKGLNKLNDDEALRVIKLSPKWHPAILYGKPVECAMSIPFAFSNH